MTDETLSPDEYLEMQKQLQVFVQLALGFDRDRLRKFIEMGEYSDATAIYTDPTAWQKGHEALTDVLDCAKALELFVSEVTAVAGRMVERHGRAL